MVTEPIYISDRIKQKLKTGKPVTGFRIFEFFRPAMAKLSAQTGFDMVVIEAEHELANTGDLADFIGCCRDNGVDVIVAPPSNDRHVIARFMDAGAIGIKLPHAETVDQVNELAGWIKYPPDGNRAFVDGPNTEFLMPDVARYCQEANAATIIFLKIESRLGLENAEAMFETGHVDGLIFGAVDLSLDCGLPGQVEHPELTSAMEKVAISALSRGIAVIGYANDVQTYHKERERGAQIFQYGNEINGLRAGANAFMKLVRSRE